jgi:predicted  nucleic acid-binding Zn-ribbon protein
MQGEYKLSSEELEAAAQQEENARLYAENSTLKERVVQLRALLNRFEKELAELSEKIDAQVGEGVTPIEPEPEPVEPSE